MKTREIFISNMSDSLKYRFSYIQARENWRTVAVVSLKVNPKYKPLHSFGWHISVVYQDDRVNWGCPLTYGLVGQVAVRVFLGSPGCHTPSWRRSELSLSVMISQVSEGSSGSISRWCCDLLALSVRIFKKQENLKPHHESRGFGEDSCFWSVVFVFITRVSLVSW